MTNKPQNTGPSTEETVDGVTVTGTAPALSLGGKPAYILAREAAELEEEEKAEGRKRAAFLAAAQDSKDRDDDSNERPGFGAAPLPGTAAPNPLFPQDIFKPDLTGAGWITCSDGTKIRDDGTSIYAPGSSLSPGQSEMILQLSVKKGWTEIYAFNYGGTSLNAKATQMLSQMIAAQAMPLRCCCDTAKAGTLSKRMYEAQETLCHVQRLRHEATQKAAAPVPKPV